jgi:hypothetical protein
MYQTRYWQYCLHILQAREEILGIMQITGAAVGNQETSVSWLNTREHMAVDSRGIPVQIDAYL